MPKACSRQPQAPPHPPQPRRESRVPAETMAEGVSAGLTVGSRDMRARGIQKSAFATSRYTPAAYHSSSCLSPIFSGSPCLGLPSPFPSRSDHKIMTLFTLLSVPCSPSLAWVSYTCFLKIFLTTTYWPGFLSIPPLGSCPTPCCRPYYD